MSRPYHKFVFQGPGNVCMFEDMYKAEDTEGFDAWGARDPRHLRMRLVKEILADYNFKYVLDIGCGIGSVTVSLKRANNHVIGIDVSQTAIEKARQTYPDIAFRAMSALDIKGPFGQYDLISVQMAFAYIPGWQRVLETLSKMTTYCVVCEYVPVHALGEVKSIEDIEEEFGRWFDVVQKCEMNDDTIILFGKVK